MVDKFAWDQGALVGPAGGILYTRGQFGWLRSAWDQIVVWDQSAKWEQGW